MDFDSLEIVAVRGPPFKLGLGGDISRDPACGFAGCPSLQYWPRHSVILSGTAASLGEAANLVPARITRDPERHFGHQIICSGEFLERLCWLQPNAGSFDYAESFASE